MKKILALGNILLSDDGIAIYLADFLEKQLNELGYSVYKCETDTSFAISVINEKDELIIFDAAFTGEQSGRVTSYTLKEYKERFYSSENYCHSTTLFDYIFNSKKIYKGYAILVEVCSMELNNRLSTIMVEEFDSIADRVLEKVKEISKIT